MSLACWQVDLNKVSLSELLSWCLLRHNVDRMLVVPGERPPVGGSSARASVKTLFGPYILDSFLASAWPGTDIFNGLNLITVLEFNETVKEIVLNTEPDFSKWRNDNKPPLPEDISLFKATASHPALVTVTHEGYAWLIDDKAPELKCRLDTITRPQALFWDGKYFCRDRKETRGDKKRKIDKKRKGRR
jgi:hypothetical protein